MEILIPELSRRLSLLLMIVYYAIVFSTIMLCFVDACQFHASIRIQCCSLKSLNLDKFREIKDHFDESFHFFPNVH